MLNYTYDDLLSPGFFHNLTLFQPIDVKFDERDPKAKEVIITRAIQNTFSCLNSSDKVLKFIGGNKSIYKEKEYFRQVRFNFLIRCALWQRLKEEAMEEHVREIIRKEMMAMLHYRLREIAAGQWARANEEFELDRMRIENEALENILRELHEGAMIELRKYKAEIDVLVKQIDSFRVERKELLKQIINDANIIAKELIKDNHPHNQLKGVSEEQVTAFTIDFINEEKRIREIEIAHAIREREIRERHATKAKGFPKPSSIEIERNVQNDPQMKALNREKDALAKEREELIPSIAKKHHIKVDNNGVIAISDMISRNTRIKAYVAKDKVVYEKEQKAWKKIEKAQENSEKVQRSYMKQKGFATGSHQRAIESHVAATESHVAATESHVAATESHVAATEKYAKRDVSQAEFNSSIDRNFDLTTIGDIPEDMTDILALINAPSPIQAPQDNAPRQKLQNN